MVKLICETCLKEYSSKKSLTMHIQNVHTKENIPCKYCNAVFTYRTAELRHYKRKHPNMFAPKLNEGKPDGRVADGNPLRCTKCLKLYTSKKILKAHMNNVHEKKILKCNYCPRICTYKASLAQHIKLKHHNAKEKQTAIDEDGIEEYVEENILDIEHFVKEAPEAIIKDNDIFNETFSIVQYGEKHLLVPSSAKSKETGSQSMKYLIQ